MLAFNTKVNSPLENTDISLPEYYFWGIGKQDGEQNRSYYFVYNFKCATTNRFQKSLIEMRMKIIWLGLKWRGKSNLKVEKPYNIPFWKVQRNILAQKKKKRGGEKKSICLIKQREKNTIIWLWNISNNQSNNTHHINRASNYSTMWEKFISILTADDSEFIPFTNVSFCFFKIVWNALCYMSQLQKLYGTPVFRPIVFLG